MCTVHSAQPMVFCSVVAVVMLESRVASCVHCAQCTAYGFLFCCSCYDVGESGGKLCALCTVHSLWFSVLL